MLLNKRFLCIVALLAAVAVWMTGCAHLYPPPKEDPRARQLLDRLDCHNAGLNRFKALADVRMASRTQAVSGRVAIAAIFPDKFRIEWLNMLGQPLTSLAGDGQTITIFSHIDSNIHKLRQSTKAMEPLIHIPIGVEDLQKILIGRVPMAADTLAQIKDDGSGMVRLLLKNRWRNLVGSLKVDSLTSRPLEMKAFDQQGELLYEIRWLQWQTAGKYLIPARLELESASGQRVALKMERFWPDAAVPESIFKLR